MDGFFGNTFEMTFSGNFRSSSEEKSGVSKKRSFGRFFDRINSVYFGSNP